MELIFDWWNNKFNKYYKLTNNYDLTDMMSNQDWIKIVFKCEPELVDEQIHDFIESLKENNCHIILLTARNNQLKELTEVIREKTLEESRVFFKKTKIPPRRLKPQKFLQKL